MDNISLTEAIIALIAGLGAWLSWRAKSEAQVATKEAEGANRAVNHNKDPNAPRLYDVVVDNAKCVVLLTLALLPAVPTEFTVHSPPTVEFKAS